VAVRNLKSVIYTDDHGNQFATKIDAALFAQVNGGGAPLIGGEDYAGSPALPAKPRQLRPRTAKVSNAGNKRRIVCLTNDADLYTGVASTINVQVLGGGPDSFTRYGSSAERWPVEHDPAQ
jgi:hypothetical protein